MTLKLKINNNDKTDMMISNHLYELYMKMYKRS